jgi:hypothetical protein
MRSLTGIAATLTISLAGAAFAQPAAPPQLDVPPPIKPSTTTGGQPVCAPDRLTRMLVRNVSPGLAAASPAAQPRVMYRKGATFLRTEESPDPTRGQPVVVIAEPDIWVFNTATRKGQHQVDPGPDFFVHAPILPLAADLPPALRALEYGCELEFLKRHGADVAQQSIPWGEARATVHQVEFDEHRISMLLNQNRRTPLLVAYAKAGKAVFMIRYDEFRDDVTERPGTFSRPDRYEFTEGPPPGVKPPAPASSAPQR